MADYKNYQFTIGESPNTRVYEGLRMPPKPDGFKFGYKLRAEMQEVILTLSNEEKQNAENGDFTELVKSLLCKFTPEIIFEYWDAILNHQAATITANEDGKTKKYVFSNDDMFNDWFSMHPEDLTEVMYSCVWENSAPFLPASWIKAMKEIKKQLKIQTETVETENQAESG